MFEFSPHHRHINNTYKKRGVLCNFCKCTEIHVHKFSSVRCRLQSSPALYLSVTFKAYVYPFRRCSGDHATVDCTKPGFHSAIARGEGSRVASSEETPASASLMGTHTAALVHRPAELETVPQPQQSLPLTREGTGVCSCLCACGASLAFGSCSIGFHRGVPGRGHDVQGLLVCPRRDSPVQPSPWGLETPREQQISATSLMRGCQPLVALTASVALPPGMSDFSNTSDSTGPMTLVKRQRPDANAGDFAHRFIAPAFLSLFFRCWSVRSFSVYIWSPPLCGTSVLEYKTFCPQTNSRR